MKLREHREQSGMFREELAKAIGTTARTIGRWENGESDMPLQTAIKLAKFFQVSLNEIAE